MWSEDIGKYISSLLALFLVLSVASVAVSFSCSATESVEEKTRQLSQFEPRNDVAWQNATESGHPIADVYGSMGTSVAYGDMTGDGSIELITGSEDMETAENDLRGGSGWYETREHDKERGAYHREDDEGKDQRAIRIWDYDEATAELEVMVETIPENLGRISSIGTDPSDSLIITGGQDESEPPRSDLRLWGYDGDSINLLHEEQWIDDDYNNTVHSIAVDDINSDGNLEVVTGGVSNFDDDGDKTKAQITVWNIEHDSSLSLSAEERWEVDDLSNVQSVEIADLVGDGTKEIITGGGSGGESEIRVWRWDGDYLTLSESITWEINSGVFGLDTADLTGDGELEVVTTGANEGMQGTHVEVAVLSYPDLEILGRDTFFPDTGLDMGDAIGQTVDAVDGTGDGDKEIYVSGMAEGPVPGGTGFYGFIMACLYSEGEVVFQADQTWLEETMTLVEDQVVLPLDGSASSDIVMIGFNLYMGEDIPMVVEHEARIWICNYGDGVERNALTIDVEGEGTTEPEPGTHLYEDGTEVTLRAIPEEDWEFVGWTGDHDDTGEEITVIMDEDKTIRAHFEEMEMEFDLTINIVGEGTTDPEPGTYTHDRDEEVTVEAMPSEGWKFVEWGGDNESNEEDISITMDEDKEVTAYFERREYELVIDVEGEGTTYPRPGDHIFEYEEEIEVEAFPDPGWTFVGWAGDHESDDENITLVIEENKSLTANFLKEPNFEVNITSPEDDEEFEEGEEIVVEFIVENTGDIDGEQKIEFLVDGRLIEMEENVNIVGGDTFQGRFTWEAEGEGDTELSVRSLDDEDEVDHSAEVVVSVREPDSPFLWWLVLVVLVVIVLVALLAKKKR